MLHNRFSVVMITRVKADQDTIKFVSKYLFANM